MFIYLASPYSHPTAFVRFERYIEAMKATRWLVEAGHSPFSPIVHCHTMANLFEMPTDAAFWKNYNFGILRKADSVYVLNLSCLADSVGVREELDFANERLLPRWRMTPITEDYSIEPF